jgi:hypothetical protein
VLQHIVGDEDFTVDEKGLLLGVLDNEIVARRLVIHIEAAP